MTPDQTSTSAHRDEIDLAIAQFGSELFGLALSITANVPDAEDAYQNAWMDATSHWHQLRDPDKRRSWLASTVARSALRVRRRHAAWLRRNASLADAEGLADVMHWDPTLAKLLGQLTERQRAVVALHYGHGYTLDETAALLHCRGGTVRSHLARALATLRKSVRNDED